MMQTGHVEQGVECRGANIRLISRQSFAEQVRPMHKGKPGQQPTP
jgi:hypothetical protein